MGRVSRNTTQGWMEQGVYHPSDTEKLIARAVVDVLLLRREMEKHDIRPDSLRQALMAASLPAFIAYEAEQVKDAP